MMATRNRFRRESLTLLLLIVVAPANVGGAQSEGNVGNLVPRTLEMLDVGYRLPIEISAVRNLQKKDHWIRDLEFEIKNVSPKPIYEVFLQLLMPDDKGLGGFPVSVDLEYGRSDLMRPQERPSADDKPIGHGETVKLNVNEPRWRGYEGHLRNENVPEPATYRVRLMIVAIYFGDGTGFTHGGVPYPRESWMEPRPQRFVRIPTT